MSSWKERLAARRKNGGLGVATKFEEGQTKSSASTGLTVSTDSPKKKMTWKERLAARKLAKSNVETPTLSASPRSGQATSNLLSDTMGSLYATSPRRFGQATSMLRQSQFRMDKLGLMADPDSDKIPEVHIIGDIIGGSGFGPCVSCKWNLTTGQGWSSLGGLQSGHTQFDSPGGIQKANGGTMFLTCISLAVIFSVGVMVLLDSVDPLPLIVLFLISVALFSFFIDSSNSSIGTSLEENAVWGHPIDVHYTTKSLEGFPRIVVHVWSLDEHDCASLVAYGFCNIPAKAGTYNLTCKTWRPVGTSEEEIARAFIRTGPQLKSNAAIFERFSDDRARLTTVGSGTVSIRVSVVMKHIRVVDE